MAAGWQTVEAVDPPQGWRFWVDRGGTFTDVIGQAPDGVLHTRKLLSEDPEHYADAALEGIDRIRRESGDESVPIIEVRMGTTVGTNALLEHAGAPTLFVATRGFEDALFIGYQNRPDIFALHIQRPRMLYAAVLGVDERHSARGEIQTPLDAKLLQEQLRAYRATAEVDACAICFMHANRFPAHEIAAGEAARRAGFEQISLSHEVSPSNKFVRRGDTAVVDAHLSPVLRRYVERVNAGLERRGAPRLFFMQSHGGLCEAAAFRGRDSLLSGPAGGVIGGVAFGTDFIARNPERRSGDVAPKLIGFDMGGTSTDVWHYAGQLERAFESEIAGARLQTPVLSIHTVAAGGGSILEFDGERLRVGPRSAGAKPGPLSYGRGGPLSLTDANLLIGRIQAEFFPRVFGPHADRALDAASVMQAFETLADTVSQKSGRAITARELAAGFIEVAVEHMSAAIKKISVQRGYDPAEYDLCSFGGAGGQHACAIADRLGMTRILLHPLAGVLSACGMGAARLRVIEESGLPAKLSAIPATAEGGWSDGVQRLERQLRERAGERLAEQSEQSPDFETSARLKYAGSDTAITVHYRDTADGPQRMRSEFADAHRRLFGFDRPEATVLIENLFVEASAGTADSNANQLRETKERSSSSHSQMPAARPIQSVPVYDAQANDTRMVPLYQRDDFAPGQRIAGLALLVSETDTVWIAENWEARSYAGGIVQLTHRSAAIDADSADAENSNDSRPTERKQGPPDSRDSHSIGATEQSLPAQADPIQLEIMNHSFRSIAEEMGLVLQQTSMSVNIKERLDFSCALFDREGALVANAPHIPVHLGSMSASVDAVRATFPQATEMRPGDAFVMNAPYGKDEADANGGGTHLPDITVVTPVFVSQDAAAGPAYFVASRGHHADVGGVSPGSMPAHSTHIEEEGVLIYPMRLRRDGRMLEERLREVFTGAKYPARNFPQNLADLAAQVAANDRGARLLRALTAARGESFVQAYMRFVQDNAARAVSRAVANIESGSADCVLDNGLRIQVAVRSPEPGRLLVDFSGTSPADAGSNFNAPLAVVKAALIYVFRTLVPDDDVPLNAGCLVPIELHVPRDCFLNPRHPCAVVAGNVETSQAIVDCLYAALGVLAASQGTMNNLSFGDESAQYYETICGGSGAGPDFDGCDAIQTHMTNSRLTDPEILEDRFPVLLESFRVRPAGGAGRQRGGDGVRREIRFLKDQDVSILSNRRGANAPPGLAGGADGAPGRNLLIPAQGPERELPSSVQLRVRSGDRLVIETPGGGGYGRHLRSGD